MRQLAVVILLLTIVYVRTGFFSIGAISAPLLDEKTEPLSGEIEAALLQKYHYLGQGSQSYALLSEDGKWVIKFFKKAYFSTPFWVRLLPGKMAMREKRRQFYQNSYRIASKMLKEETGIAYLHQGPSPEPLPQITLTDKKGRSHKVDLQKFPFVLQRKADPFYESLRSLSQAELTRTIEQFFSLLAIRIDRKIRDGDHKIESNFGVLDGNVVLIDPGRLYLDENPLDPAGLKEEWVNTTHRLKKWLVANAPEQVPIFETALKARLE